MLSILLVSFDYWKFQIFQLALFIIFVYYVIQFLNAKTDGIPSKFIRSMIDLWRRKWR